MSLIPITARAAFRLDLRLQWRYGFVYAAAFSAVLWDAIVIILPEPLQGPAMPYLIFGDLGIVGFFFLAGAVFFERGERTLDAVVTTPMRFGDYLASKLTTLSLLSLVLTLLITVSGVGLDFDPVTLLLGTVLCSLVCLLASFISATPFTSISDWIIPSTAVIAVLSLPMAFYSGLWESPALYLAPTQGSLLLLGESFGQSRFEVWDYVYAIGSSLLWIVLLTLWARRAFYRHVVKREGGR
ncbi:hypothetical protein [Stackebrandtia nassauensis]|uniref:ABC-2 type transporter n=1 Tax=Stackebrandtia nassauensis (strain DSM 44728 / CIP 108903 / NRRL B-16338 / NBRC 102104 / LLR-40K-21) TaxID=446470 RepID=D3Q7I3_STANL|nr:hypothetical protein [Stackebrandtia nassauensis]ADD44325.1 hypothetical protein Snas_4682 [Stackebrandtia nassauensis DSM 44728]